MKSKWNLLRFCGEEQVCGWLLQKPFLGKPHLAISPICNAGLRRFTPKVNALEDGGQPVEEKACFQAECSPKLSINRFTAVPPLQ
jgi:hypothetical protein